MAADLKKRRFLATIILVISASAGLIVGLGIKHVNEPQPTYADFAGYLPHLKPVNRGESSADSLEGKTLLVNFWATWCPPCIEEIPLLDRFNSEFGEKEFQIIGVAFDDAEPVEEFIRQWHVKFLSITGDVTLVDQLMNTLGNDELVLPFSVVFSSDGTLKLRKYGPFEEPELSALISGLNRG